MKKHIWDSVSVITKQHQQTKWHCLKIGQKVFPNLQVLITYVASKKYLLKRKRGLSHNLSNSPSYEKSPTSPASFTLENSPISQNSQVSLKNQDAHCHAAFHFSILFSPYIILNLIYPTTLDDIEALFKKIWVAYALDEETY